MTGTVTSPTTPAVLVLEDGRAYYGDGFGATGSAFGEAVFSTGMTGYQETLTDPSYRRQVVVATAPQIGNTGWVAGDGTRFRATGRTTRRTTSRPRSGWPVTSSATWRPRPSNYRATSSLPDEMERQGVVGISGVDTRALTRHLRTAGAMRCGIFSGRRSPT